MAPRIIEFNEVMKGQLDEVMNSHGTEVVSEAVRIVLARFVSAMPSLSIEDFDMLYGQVAVSALRSQTERLKVYLTDEALNGFEAIETRLRYMGWRDSAMTRTVMLALALQYLANKR